MSWMSLNGAKRPTIAGAGFINFHSEAGSGRETSGAALQDDRLGVPLAENSPDGS